MMKKIGIIVFMHMWYCHGYAAQTLIIHVVRHGATDVVTRESLYGYMGPPLNQLGKEQAAALADRLVGRLIERIYCSPQQRAVTTAMVIANRLGVPVVIDDRLRERSFGSTEGVHNVEQFLQDNPHHTIEPLSTHVGRLLSFFKEVAQRQQQEIYIVGHSCVAKSLFEYLNLPQGSAVVVKNCSICTFAYDPVAEKITFRSLTACPTKL